MPTTKRSSREYKCSFCGKPQSQVKHLVAGPSRVFVCDQCVNLCLQIITEEAPAPTKHKAAPSLRKIPPPQEIHKHLSEYVVEQDQAKKVLSVAVYNHYKRVWSPGDVELQKSNILLVGPTGCGKTLLAQTLARILDVPFAISDATSLTEAGYVGDDVENILLRLVQAADYDIARAEQGIIYIDEIDKISRRGPNPSITRDVSGEGVQQGLLKIIEGCVANVPPQGGRKHPHQEFLQIRTDGILFICGGTFDGLEKIIKRRGPRGHGSLGFKARSSKETLLHWGDEDTVIPDDLLEFGFIPEFVGRMPVLVQLHPLGKEGLIRVLTEPKNAVVKQYQNMFGLDGVDLQFTPEALKATAEEALNQKTGARSLRTIIEEVLLDAMYHIPSLPEVKRCIVDSDAIQGKRRPLLLDTSDTPLDIGKSQKKSA